MEIQLDYQRMADTVYAFAALRALEAAPATNIIGRDEEDALKRHFEWALTEVCLTLGPAVSELDPRRGRVVIADPCSELLHRALECAVINTVLAFLKLTDDSPAPYVALLRTLISIPPPPLSPNF